MTRRAFLQFVALTPPALSPTAARAQERGFSFSPPQASTIAPRVDALFYVILGISTVISLGVCLLIIFFCFRYRRGTSADRSHPPDKNLKLEAAWIITPILLSTGVFVWAARLYFDLYRAPPGAIVINVIGKQWMWKLQHPEGQREINELHVPVGRPVKLELRSEDVIHSFDVPAFRIKQDAVPGRTTTTWFEATKTGRYRLYCSQYCGLDHSRMQGWVTVMPAADYQQWLNANPSGEATAAAEGAKLFQQFGCSGCHVASDAVRAPVLNGIYGKPVPLSTGKFVIADDAYIRDSIVLPKSQVVSGYKPVMPSYKGALSEERIQELIAYIKSLTPADAQPDNSRSLNGAERPGGAQEMQQDAKQRMKESRQPAKGDGNR